MIGFGRYNLLLKLGQGGMGAVYLARQKTLRRFCAVKVISPQYARDQAAADRFLREARATAALAHPNLVSVFDCDQHEGQYFIAMEYVEGLSLAQIIRNFGALPLPLALGFLKQAAVGLEYVHGKGIIHRDIKPDNMIVDSTGVLKIMDLGLAKDRLEGDQGMTVTGTVMGSPHYMSPEQINDSKTADHRTDLYSLGISFYQMVTGHVPYQQSSVAAVCVAHLQEAIPSVALEDAETTQALDALIASMVAKNREERIQSATDLLAGIEPWLSSYPLDAPHQELLSTMGFEKHKVSYLLENSCTDTTNMDGDVAATTFPTGLGAPSAPATVMASQTSPSKAHSSLAYLKWAIAGAGVLLVLLVVGIGMSLFYGSDKAGSAVPASPAPDHSTVAPPTPAPPPATPTPVVAAPSSPSNKVGGVVVKTKPDNASVMLPKLAKSQSSPATFGELPVGKYLVKAVKAGYRDKQQEVEVKEGDFAEVNLDLERIPGRIRIESNPVGAEVYVDNRLIKKTPCELEGGDGEEMHGELRMEGYHHQPFHVILKEAGDSKVIALQAAPKSPSPGGPGRPSEAAPFKPSEPGGDGTPGQPGPSRGEPGPGGSGGPGSMKEGFQHCQEMFDMARNASRDEWQNKTRAFMLGMAESRMKSHNPNPRDPNIRKAIADLSRLLERVRGLNDEQYKSQQNDLILNMMRIMQSGMGMMGGPQGGGPGGGGGGFPRR